MTPQDEQSWYPDYYFRHEAAKYHRWREHLAFILSTAWQLATLLCAAYLILSGIDESTGFDRATSELWIGITVLLGFVAWEAVREEE